MMRGSDHRGASVGSALFIAGCAAVSTSRDGGAGYADAATRDATIVETRDVVAADAADGLTTCALTAEGPRALRLRGLATLFADAGTAGPVTLTQDLILFLPRGRAPGAPLIVGFSDYAERFIEVPGMFDARGALNGLRFDGWDRGQVSWVASMSAPDGPLALRINRNTNITTDVPTWKEGEATLCPDGDAPAPTFAPIRALGPVGPWRFGASAPLSSGVESITLRANGLHVDASARWDAGLLTVTLARAVPPDAALALDLAATRDPAGRVFTLDGAAHVLGTTAVVTDHTFAAAPPPGAVAPSHFATADGALRLSSPSRRSSPFIALVALGDTPAGAVTLRYRVRYGRPDEYAAWLVRADGTSFALTIDAAPPADPTMPDREVSAVVTGSGSLWLQVESLAEFQRPGWGVPRIASVFELDEVHVGR